MDIVKVHFGANRPNEIDYRKQADGFAEVWLYKDIQAETDADGNTDFVADGVMFRTALSKKEVEEQRDSYFEQEECASLEDRIKMLEEQLATMQIRLNKIDDHQYEVVKPSFDADNPIDWVEGMTPVNNAFYRLPDGKVYVWMNEWVEW